MDKGRCRDVQASLPPKLLAIREKYKDGVPDVELDAFADKLAGMITSVGVFDGEKESDSEN